MRVLPLLLAPALLLCGSCRLLGLSDPWEDVQGVPWHLVAIEGEAAPPDLDVRLQFDGGGRLFGEVGSAPYFGTYARTGRSGLRIGKIGAALTPHPTDASRHEERYLALLGESNGFDVDDGGLRLSRSGSDALAFVQER